jgi:hypothetical protein
MLFIVMMEERHGKLVVLFQRMELVKQLWWNFPMGASITTQEFIGQKDQTTVAAEKLGALMEGKLGRTGELCRLYRTEIRVELMDVWRG